MNFTYYVFDILDVESWTEARLQNNLRCTERERTRLIHIWLLPGLLRYVTPGFYEKNIAISGYYYPAQVDVFHYYQLCVILTDIPG